MNDVDKRFDEYWLGIVKGYTADGTHFYKTVNAQAIAEFCKAFIHQEIERAQLEIANNMDELPYIRGLLRNQAKEIIEEISEFNVDGSEHKIIEQLRQKYLSENN